PDREVLVDRAEVRPYDLEGNTGICPVHHKLVSQLEQRERGLDLMKPGRPPRQNAEKQVDLGVGHHAQRGHDRSCCAAWRTSRSRKCSRESDQNPSSVIGMNVVTW